MRQKLLVLGMFLFLLGLLTGFVMPVLKNPRLGLSAHLEGAMNGMFLILVGMIWEKVKISSQLQKITFTFLILGSYTNWLACLLGASFGASRMTPIAGMGMVAEPWQELLVAFLFITVGLTMTMAVALLSWGLWKSDTQTDQSAAL